MAISVWRKKPRVLKESEYRKVIHVGVNGVTTPSEEKDHIYKIDDKTIKVLVSEGAIRRRTRTLTKQIFDYYEEEQIYSLDVVIILTGGIQFGKEIIEGIQKKNLERRIRENWIHITSYEDQQSTGNARIEKDFLYSIKGRHVLLVEDISDTLTTFDFIKQYALDNEYRKPASLKAVTLFDKLTPKRKKLVPVHEVTEFSPPKTIVDGIEYLSGFHLGKDIYLIGCGMDGSLGKDDNIFRAYPFIGHIVDKRRKY